MKRSITHIITWIVAGILLLVGMSACTLFDKPGDASTFVREFSLQTGAEHILEVREVYYSYDGWMGDGAACYELKLDETALDEIMKWEPLPFNGMAKEFSEMNLKQEFHSAMSVANGYWRFIDRNSSHHLGNFSLGIYDADTEILYWIRSDS